MPSLYEDIMKTWEKMNDVAWVNHLSSRPMGVAGRAGLGRYGFVTVLVVQAFAGDWYSAQDCLFSQASGRAGVVSMSD
jgi:hypothetical protein